MNESIVCCIQRGMKSIKNLNYVYLHKVWLVMSVFYDKNEEFFTFEKEKRTKTSGGVFSIISLIVGAVGSSYSRYHAKVEVYVVVDNVRASDFLVSVSKRFDGNAPQCLLGYFQ
jgi:hypothetical protein